MSVSGGGTLHYILQRTQCTHFWNVWCLFKMRKSATEFGARLTSSKRFQNQIWSRLHSVKSPAAKFQGPDWGSLSLGDGGLGSCGADVGDWWGFFLWYVPTINGGTWKKWMGHSEKNMAPQKRASGKQKSPFTIDLCARKHAYSINIANFLQGGPRDRSGPMMIRGVIIQNRAAGIKTWQCHFCSQYERYPQLMTWVILASWIWYIYVTHTYIYIEIYLCYIYICWFTALFTCRDIFAQTCKRVLRDGTGTLPLLVAELPELPEL